MAIIRQNWSVCQKICTKHLEKTNFYALRSELEDGNVGAPVKVKEHSSDKFGSLCSILACKAVEVTSLVIQYDLQ